MLKFKLGKLGEHTPKIPNSLAVIFEMVTAWSDEPTKTELGFICAAAVSLSIEAEGKPRHKVEKPLLEYGRQCIEFLLSSGVSITDIYTYGSYILTKSIEKLPQSAEVDDKTDFLSAQEPDSLNG
jgi:hypothetical protein